MMPYLQDPGRTWSLRLANRDMMAASSKKKLNPVKARYEFMGPIGTVCLAVGLPCVVLALSILCNSRQCTLRFPPLFWPKPLDFFYKYGFPVMTLWFGFQMLIYKSPLGKVVEGTELRDGSKLTYKINGIHAYAISHVVFILAYLLGLRVSVVYDRFLGFSSAAILFAFIISYYLYIKSFQEGALLATGGNSGNKIYDWFMGRELNPRVGDLDLKMFCEMRPGLILWVLINYCMLIKQYEVYGYVTVSMILVCLFQFWYVLDALWFEESVLTTMDIVHDGFGFMLVFGDLAWVPFTYSLQARYLVNHPTHLPWYAIAGICAINVIGYIIFRCSNSQKHAFRCDPDQESVCHLFTLHTDRGTRLIISGWWGLVRHPNYVGDLIMALSWSLPCGFSVLPYFYPVYFTVLLLHRQLRDEAQCRLKYGKDWDKFCKIVEWRLIPYIY